MMYGISTKGKPAPRLYKSRTLALADWWNRKPSHAGIHYTENRCLKAMQGIAEIVEVGIKVTAETE